MVTLQLFIMAHIATIDHLLYILIKKETERK